MIYLQELEAIGRTQTGMGDLTVELVEDLLDFDGSPLYGRVWRKNGRHHIKIDAAHWGHEWGPSLGMLHTLLHEVAHIFRGIGGHGIIKARLLRQNKIEAMDGVHVGVMTPDGPMTEEDFAVFEAEVDEEMHPYWVAHYREELSCDDWASLALITARHDSGGTLGGVIKHLAENQMRR